MRAIPLSVLLVNERSGSRFSGSSNHSTSQGYPSGVTHLSNCGTPICFLIWYKRRMVMTGLLGVPETGEKETSSDRTESCGVCVATCRQMPGKASNDTWSGFLAGVAP